MDFIIADNGDYLIENGDLVIGNADNQQSYYILNSTYNSFKDKPFYALNFLANLNGNTKRLILERNIREMLQLDGFKSIDIDLSDKENINVNATRV